MDTSFGPDVHIPAAPTLGHQLTSSYVVVSPLKFLNFFFLLPQGLEENYFVMPKEKCSDCEPLEAFKEVLLSSEALKPKLDRCLKVTSVLVSF